MPHVEGQKTSVFFRSVQRLERTLSSIRSHKALTPAPVEKRKQTVDGKRLSNKVVSDSSDDEDTSRFVSSVASSASSSGVLLHLEMHHLVLAHLALDTLVDLLRLALVLLGCFFFWQFASGGACSRADLSRAASSGGASSRSCLSAPTASPSYPFSFLPLLALLLVCLCLSAARNAIQFPPLPWRLALAQVLVLSLLKALEEKELFRLVSERQGIKKNSKE